jgi:hypothetical protein
MRIRHKSAASGVALLIAAVAVGVGTTVAHSGETTHRVVAAAPVHEDEPGWNCWTMGNADCGTMTYLDATDGRGGSERRSRIRRL